MTREEALKIFKERCRNGEHPLEEICSVEMDIICDKVVRWCPICGSIAVDIDTDNRVHPGYFAKMRRPAILSPRK